MKGGTRVDVQGFVYWDPDHVNAAFHFYSGWEIHPLSAWRVSTGLQVNPFERWWDFAPAALTTNPQGED
jgi:hypothetical protein